MATNKFRYSNMESSQCWRLSWTGWLEGNAFRYNQNTVRIHKPMFNTLGRNICAFDSFSQCFIDLRCVYNNEHAPTGVLPEHYSPIKLFQPRVFFNIKDVCCWSDEKLNYYSTWLWRSTQYTLAILADSYQTKHVYGKCKYALSSLEIWNDLRTFGKLNFVNVEI